MGRPGRPKVYTEKRVPINLYLPEVVVNKLDEIAYERDISRTELIHSLIIQGDWEEAVLLAKNFKELKEQVRELLKVNKRYEEYFSQIMNKNSFIEIYSDIKIDDNLIEFFKDRKIEKIVRNRYNPDGTLKEDAPPLKLMIDHIYERFEEYMIDKGKMIKNKHVVKYMIKKMIMEIDKKISPKHLPK